MTRENRHMEYYPVEDTNQPKLTQIVNGEAL